MQSGTSHSFAPVEDPRPALPLHNMRSPQGSSTREQPRHARPDVQAASYLMALEKPAETFARGIGCHPRFPFPSPAPEGTPGTGTRPAAHSVAPHTRLGRLPVPSCSRHPPALALEEPLAPARGFAEPSLQSQRLSVPYPATPGGTGSSAYGVATADQRVARPAGEVSAAFPPADRQPPPPPGKARLA